MLFFIKQLYNLIHITTVSRLKTQPVGRNFQFVHNNQFKEKLEKYIIIQKYMCVYTKISNQFLFKQCKI